MKFLKIYASKEEKSNSFAHEVKKRRYKLAKLKQKRKKCKTKTKKRKWTKEVST